MKLTYDDEVGAAYLRLRGDDEEVLGPVTSETFRPPGSEAGDDYFVLDFDADGDLSASSSSPRTIASCQAFWLGPRDQAADHLDQRNGVARARFDRGQLSLDGG